MPPTDLAAVKADAVRELSRRSLAQFARRAWPVLEPATPLKWGWALDAICEHLEAVTAGDIRRLLMNVPPGSMKSLLTGVIWPAWEWGPCGLPSKRFIGTAHKEALAVRDSMKCRRLIQSAWFQHHWPIRLTSDQNAKTKFENDATGFREAMAFTSMTGSRGDRVVLDDPHSVDDANSPTKLAADITTFREALPSRVNNDQSAIVIVMQRLNEADVSSVAVELGYDHLCIPMRFEADRRCVTRVGWSDPRTEDGELMFPERFPEHQVAELEATLGSYAAAGQLQQRPAPRTGGMFKREWFPIIHALPPIAKSVRAWDLAASTPKPGTSPDWTAGVLMHRAKDGRFIVTGCHRMQASAAAVEAAITQRAATDGKATAVRLPQDPGQAGKAQARAFINALAGWTVKAVTPTGDKVTRASPASAQAEVGNIAILATGDPAQDAWIGPFLDELCVFPAGRHDDQVDAFADALNHLAGKSSGYTLDNL